LFFCDEAVREWEAKVAPVLAEGVLIEMPCSRFANDDVHPVQFGNEVRVSEKRLRGSCVDLCQRALVNREAGPAGQSRIVQQSVEAGLSMQPF
jgi:hypothetical protein